MTTKSERACGESYMPAKFIDQVNAQNMSQRDAADFFALRHRHCERPEGHEGACGRAEAPAAPLNCVHGRPGGAFCPHCIVPPIVIPLGTGSEPATVASSPAVPSARERAHRLMDDLECPCQNMKHRQVIHSIRCDRATSFVEQHDKEVAGLLSYVDLWIASNTSQRVKLDAARKEADEAKAALAEAVRQADALTADLGEARATLREVAECGCPFELRGIKCDGSTSCMPHKARAYFSSHPSTPAPVKETTSGDVHFIGAGVLSVGDHPPALAATTPAPTGRGT